MNSDGLQHRSDPYCVVQRWITVGSSGVRKPFMPGESHARLVQTLHLKGEAFDARQQ